MKDNIFNQPITKQFEFDENVASVFDDMIGRSVPYYDVSLTLVCDILSRELKQNARVIDLGCSTATALLALWSLRPDLTLFGIDEAEAMISRAKTKAKAFGAKLELHLGNILNYDLYNFDAVILNYTLQFIRPIYRLELLQRIHNSINQNGIMIISEKIIYEDKKLAKNMIEVYENYKIKQGYSKYEIAQKREALENVLIPYSEDENKKLMLNAGFKDVQSIFKWGNFMTFMAFK